MKIDEILAWAGPEQFHLNSNDILIENLWDSGLGQPWGISFKFLLRSWWSVLSDGDIHALVIDVLWLYVFSVW